MFKCPLSRDFFVFSVKAHEFRGPFLNTVYPVSMSKKSYTNTVDTGTVVLLVRVVSIHRQSQATSC